MPVSRPRSPPLTRSLLQKGEVGLERGEMRKKIINTRNVRRKPLLGKCIYDWTITNSGGGFLRDQKNIMQPLALPAFPTLSLPLLSLLSATPSVRHPKPTHSL